MTPRQNIHIDHLRGLAILGVFAHHFSQSSSYSLPFISTYGGLLGVQLFFALSGYLIAESSSRHPLGHYALHRMLRIFPAYWFAYLVIGFGITHSINWAKVVEFPGAFLLTLTNLQQLDPVALFDFNVLYTSWSLTVEVLWYILAPLIVWIGRDRPWAVLGTLLGISMAWTWLAPTGQLQPLFESRLAETRTPIGPAHIQLLINAAFPAQVVHFGWGAMLYFYRGSWERIPVWLPWLIALSLLALLPTYISSTVFSLLLSGVGMAALMLGVMRLPKFELPPLAWAGKVSYSIYLLHMPIVVYCHGAFAHLGEAKWLVMFGLLGLSSALMQRWIEAPSMSLARRLTR